MAFTPETTFRHDRAPKVGVLHAPPLAELLGPPRGRDEPLGQRHRDIARSAIAVIVNDGFTPTLAVMVEPSTMCSPG